MSITIYLHNDSAFDSNPIRVHDENGQRFVWEGVMEPHQKQFVLIATSSNGYGQINVFDDRNNTAVLHSFLENEAVILVD